MYSTPVIDLGVSLSVEHKHVGNKHVFGLSLFGLSLSLSLVGPVTWFCLDFVVLWEMAQGCHLYLFL